VAMVTEELELKSLVGRQVLIVLHELNEAAHGGQLYQPAGGPASELPFLLSLPHG
jgi:hypothetical protein